MNVEGARESNQKCVFGVVVLCVLPGHLLYELTIHGHLSSSSQLLPHFSYTIATETKSIDHGLERRIPRQTHNEDNESHFW